MFSWGSNFFGQLGYGGVESCNSPRRIETLSGVCMHSYGESFIFLLRQHRATHWGDMTTLRAHRGHGFHGLLRVERTVRRSRVCFCLLCLVLCYAVTQHPGS